MAKGTGASGGEEPPASPETTRFLRGIRWYECCSRGRISSDKAVEESFCASLAWTSTSVSLLGPSEKALQSFKWDQVSGLWFNAGAREGHDLYWEMGFEVSGGGPEYLRVTAPVDEAAGRFLQFLQGLKADRIKSGPPPRLAMGRVGASLYELGVPIKRFRVFVGWATVLAEAFFSFGFLAQLHKTLLSREDKLLQLLGEIASSLHRTGGLTALLVFLHHLFVLVFVVNNLLSTWRASLRSLKSFGKVGQKASKSFRKRYSNLMGTEDATPPAANGPAAVTEPETSATDGLRRRRGPGGEVRAAQ